MNLTPAHPDTVLVMRRLMIVAAVSLAIGGLGAADREAQAQQGGREACVVRGVANRAWLVHFERNSSHLSERGRAILGVLAEEWEADGGYMLGIRPHIDAAENSRSDRTLASSRGEEVRRFLVSKGIPSDRTFVDTSESPALRVPTPPDASEPENRVVVLTPVGVGYRLLWQRRHDCANWLRENCLGLRKASPSSCEDALRFIAPPLE
jgi:hypothetical protein